MRVRIKTLKKKGQAEPIIAGVVALIILPILIAAVLQISSDAGEQRCAPYKEQLGTCNNNLERMNAQSQQLRDQLNLSEEKYVNLTTTNITKKDINDILGELNRTRIEVNYVRNELINVNNTIVSSLNAVLYNFDISVAINITLLGLAALDLAFLAFGVDIKKLVIGKIKDKFKRKPEEHKKEKESTL